MTIFVYAILAAALGIGLGYVLGVLIGKKKRNALTTEVEVLKNENLHLAQEKEATVVLMEKRILEKKEEAEAMLRNERVQAQQYLAEVLAEKDKSYSQLIESQKVAHEKSYADLEKRFKETTDNLASSMKAATESMLKQRQEEFAQASRNDLGNIVTPLRETIDKMKKSMDDNTFKQAEMSSSMKASVESMIRHSDLARKSAEELTRVFKHENKVQGDWGETVLGDLLSSQGLTEGIHYDIQATIRDAHGVPVRTAEGSYLRPDIILHLDQRREVIIDSKVSLKAFFDYINSETEAEKSANLKAHIESIQNHIKELGKKDYSSYIQPPKVKMNYVIMFVPHSAALWTAINEIPGLWRKAMDEHKVCIADEQSLYSVLNIINMAWTQIAQAENHQKVYELANEIIERVGIFYKKYQEVGKALQSAQKSYEESSKKLENGGQSIIQSSNKLIALGAKQSSRNPLPLINTEENTLLI